MLSCTVPLPVHVFVASALAALKREAEVEGLPIEPHRQIGSFQDHLVPRCPQYVLSPTFPLNLLPVQFKDDGFTASQIEDNVDAVVLHLVPTVAYTC